MWWVLVNFVVCGGALKKNGRGKSRLDKRVCYLPSIYQIYYRYVVVRCTQSKSNAEEISVSFWKNRFFSDKLRPPAWNTSSHTWKNATRLSDRSNVMARIGGVHTVGGGGHVSYDGKVEPQSDGPGPGRPIMSLTLLIMITTPSWCAVTRARAIEARPRIIQATQTPSIHYNAYGTTAQGPEAAAGPTRATVPVTR